ncbi:MAG: Lrp/AsnC family transcriptional regulator [Saccharofermentanales bacterium]
MDLKNEILLMLEKNAKLTASDIAVQLGADLAAVTAIIETAEKEKLILGYRTLINWDKTDDNSVTAMIEVKITPQNGQGFDRIAHRIYSFPQVKDCYLMSGGFDLMIIMEGKSLRDVANFISEKVAQLDHVLSTATHFILKRYKSNGTVYEYTQDNDREAVVL